MRYTKGSLTLVGCMMAGACAAGVPTSDVEAVAATLDSMHMEHAAAHVRGDVDALMEIYTNDPVIRSNHVAPLRGSEALRDFIEGFFSAVDMQHMEYATDELAVFGDSVYAIGTFKASGTTTDDQPVAEEGSYMVLYLRGSDGVWRSHRGVFNSSLPLPTG